PVKRTITGVASVALILCLAPAVGAQTAVPASDDAAYKAAHDRFVVGARLLREGKREHNPAKLERAYLEFRQGNSVYSRSKAGLLDLVESELATNRMLDAMNHLREYARLHGAPDSGEYKTNFQQQWDIAFQATGHVRVVAPATARIVLDGAQSAGVAPLADPVDVAPGHHRVEALGTAEPLRAEVDATTGVVVDALLAPHAVASLPPQVAGAFPRATSRHAADRADRSAGRWPSPPVLATDSDMGRDRRGDRSGLSRSRRDVRGRGERGREPCVDDPGANRDQGMRGCCGTIWRLSGPELRLE
ncbi:MAG: hypothetical protein ACRELB_16460, partial [Polyangiaceae bacterium]